MGEIFDHHFTPEWCEICGREGHNGLACTDEMWAMLDDGDDYDDDGSD